MAGALYFLNFQSFIILTLPTLMFVKSSLIHSFELLSEADLTPQSVTCALLPKSSTLFSGLVPQLGDVGDDAQVSWASLAWGDLLPSVSPPPSALRRPWMKKGREDRDQSAVSRGDNAAFSGDGSREFLFRAAASMGVRTNSIKMAAWGMQKESNTAHCPDSFQQPATRSRECAIGLRAQDKTGAPAPLRVAAKMVGQVEHFLELNKCTPTAILKSIG